LAVLGLLSDSHGNAIRTAHAVALLVDAGADMLIHLGDINSTSVIDALVTFLPGTTEQVETRIVFGNTDWDADAMGHYATGLGIRVDHPAGRIEAEGKTIAFTHGHLDSVMRQAVAEGVDYLLHGHTHEQADNCAGATRIINPGALTRAIRYTVATLRPDSGELTVIELPDA